jgi:penicillin-binding protein 1C
MKLKWLKIKPIKLSKKDFSKKHKITLAVFLVVFCYWLFCLPAELFTSPKSTVVKSREGILLGARIADDGQWRFPKMDSVPQKFEQCIIHFEDEYFYWHPGFNPVSIAKALWHNLTTDDRRGGSTISQQVIRLSRKNQERSYWEKLIELFWATRLEAGKSKKEILALYASHAPFGGNTVGLKAASWLYFGIPPEQLTWGQAAGLAVLPNAPSLVYPGKNEPILKEKRDGLLLKLFQNKIIDETTFKLAVSEPLPREALPLPEIAPHFTELIRREHPQEQVETTLDYSLQKTLNRIAKTHYEKLSQNQIHNLAILVLEVDTRKVLGYVGNSPTTPENDKYVDIVQRQRSTGSILKPFLYAALFDSGELLPEMLVKDIPTLIDGYSPENFDRKHYGAVPANQALARSLNVPAVRLLQKYGLERFGKILDKIKLSGIDKPANYYGLPLILGGAESSLWDITNAYAGMAATLDFFNRTSSEYPSKAFSSPVYLKDKKIEYGKKLHVPPVFDAGAIYETFQSLREVNRPLGETNWQFFSDAQPIAWKTGTSYGFKDAWAVGVTPKYAIGVWAGNADGEGRPGLTGIQAAAPILFDVLDVLPNSGWFSVPHDELAEAKICKKSGHLAGLFCDEAKTALIPREGLKSKSCPYCQPVFLAEKNGKLFRVNSSCHPISQMKKENWFSLPPVMEYYYASNHPEYEALPPFAPNCIPPGEKIMEFVFPRGNEDIILPRNFEEKLNEVVLKLVHQIPETTVYWYLDERYLGSTKTFHEIGILPKPGKYLLTVVDERGNELKQWVEIAMASD